MNNGTHKKDNKTFGAAGGFTLLEVLVALVILGIALIPLITAEIRAQNAYATFNGVMEETLIAKNLMSKITYYVNGVSPMDKKGEVKYNKNYLYLEKISATSFRGIFLIEVDVYKKGGRPSSGVTLKSLSR